MYRAQGRALDALNDYNRAIQMTPSNGQAYYNRGLLYQAQGQHKFAVDDFSTAIGLIQQQAEPYIARGLSRLALGDTKTAAGDLDDAVTIDPRQPERLDQPRACLRAARREGESRRLLRQGAQPQQGARRREERLRPRRGQDRHGVSDVLVRARGSG